MITTKITVLSVIAVAMLGTASFADGTSCFIECEPPDPPRTYNPGNGKEVGNSPWDGITGNSGRNTSEGNRGAPPAAPMYVNDQDYDTPYPQPGGKDETGPSNANKD